MDDSLPRRALIGVRFTDSGFDSAGLTIIGVEADSMAARAGMQAGDQLVSIGSRRIRQGADLAAASRHAGTHPSIELVFRRDHALTTAVVSTSPYPLEPTCGGELELAEVRAADDARLRLFVVTPPGNPARCVFYLPGIALESVEADAQPSLQALIGELSARGVASARLERRGIGDSEGGAADRVDFETEVADAAAALSALSARFSQVVLLGHSVGGMIAPLIADRGAAAVCVFGSSSASWFECIDASTRRQLERRGADASAIAEVLATRRALFESGQSDDERPHAFHAQLARAELARAWRQLEVPVLALWGDRDGIVSREESLEIAALCRGEQRTLPDLDHAGEPSPGKIALALTTWLDDTLES